MSSNEIETNNVNRSLLAEQGPSSIWCSRQRNIDCRHANLLSLVREESGQENNIAWSAIY